MSNHLLQNQPFQIIQGKAEPVLIQRYRRDEKLKNKTEINMHQVKGLSSDQKYIPSSLQKQFRQSSTEYQIIIDKLKGSLNIQVTSKEPSINYSINDFLFREQFKILKQIGHGMFSQVHLAKEEISGMLFAVKIITKKTISQYNIREALVREIKIQQSLTHQNLIPLFGYFQDENNVYLLSQYCEQGELLNLSKQLNQRQKVSFVKQILSAVQYMHSRKIMHRDLKPENILISMNSVMIGDFGCAAPFPTVGCRRTSFCGTVDYLSPELINGGGKIPDPNNQGQQIYKGYDEKCDIWAIGVLIYEMYVGNTPFGSKKEKNVDIIMGLIAKGEFFIPRDMHPLFKDFITQCLTLDPKKRPSVSQLLLHEWLRM